MTVGETLRAARNAADISLSVMAVRTAAHVGGPEVAREAVSDRDAGVRWCSAVMLLPPDTSDERWDVFLAALAEHLAARDGQGSPWWAESRSLRWWWFPFNTRAARVDALVHAPAAFRRREVHVAAQELGVA
jgi:hypothetical protein